MKTKTLILNLVTLATAVGLATGCSSTGNDKAASTARSLAKSSDMIVKGNTLVDQTMAALNDLVMNPNADMRKQFDTFSSSVNDLGSIDKDVTCKATEMKSEGADYFANWDKETAQMLDRKSVV